MASIKLYNGEVELTFNPVKHLYSVDGVIVPSVTRVLGVVNKPALIPWAVKETVTYLQDALRPGVTYTQEQLDAILYDAKGARFRKSKDALNIGSEAHDWIERHIKAEILHTPKPELPSYPPVRAAVDSYLEWEAQQMWVVYKSSEKRIYSREHMFSGTVDIVMNAAGETIVADLKTSKGIYPEYLLQCAAYAKAYEEETGDSVSKIMVIRIPKDGNEVEVQTNDNVDELYDVFLSCLSLWRWREGWSTTAEKWTVD